jgi:hypothetical protein
MTTIQIPILVSEVGTGLLTINYTATTFNLSLKLDNNQVYFSTELAVNWDPQVLQKFVADVSLNPSNWFPKSWLPLDMSNMPVAVSRLSETELQVRVGYLAPPGPIFNLVVKLDPSNVPITKPSHTRSPLLKVGDRVTLIPSKLPNMRVGHFAFGLINRPFLNDALLKKDCTFIVERGLVAADQDFISLRSVNFPNFYVNHFCFLLNISAKEDGTVYKQNASFYPAVGSADGKAVTLYSQNFPQMAVRHALNRLVINQKESTTAFTNDSTFNVIPGLWAA